MILVELIFNFTGLLNENYKQYQKNNKEYFTSSSIEATTTAKPTISYSLTRKATPDLYNDDNEEYRNMPITQVTLNGTELYVIDIGSLPTSVVLLKTDNQVYSYSDSDKLEPVPENRFDKKQQFNIFRITGFLSFNKHVKKQAVNSGELKFPFFVIKPASDSDKYLGYSDKKFFVNNSFSIKYNTINKVKYGDSIEHLGTDINISLKFSDDSQEKLFDKIEALDFSSFTPSGKLPEYTEKDCDEGKENLIPKRAVESLCLSCNPDLIQ